MNLQLILASILVFLVIILLLVVILLVAKKYLLPSGNVKVTINGENRGWWRNPPLGEGTLLTQGAAGPLASWLSGEAQGRRIYQGTRVGYGC